MPNAHCSVQSVAVPAESGVARLYDAPHLADAYAVRLPDNAIDNPELLARFLFAHQAGWVAKLMGLRDALVARFGLKTTQQLRTEGSAGSWERVDIFRIYTRSARERSSSARMTVIWTSGFQYCSKPAIRTTAARAI